MSTIDGASALSGYGMTSFAEPGGDMGRTEFMQLLVAQLQHQDPLDPVTNEDFVAQLATFSSLEQLQEINSGTQTGLMMQQSMSNEIAASLIGKDVLVDDSYVTHETGETNDFRVDIEEDAIITAKIYNENGDLMRTMTFDEEGLPMAAGEHTFTWDGKDDSGQLVTSGTYMIDVSAADGSGVDVTAKNQVRGHVDGIRYANGNVFLLVGDKEYTLADVMEILKAREEVVVEIPEQDIEPGEDEG
jgi:flagellar basal-body rod modification protein FlgD